MRIRTTLTLPEIISRHKDIVFAIILGVIILSLFFVHEGHGPMLGGLDVAMFRAINRDMQNTVLDSLAATSNIGSMDIYVFILLVSSLLFLSMIRHSKDLRKSAMILVIALVFSIIIVYPLKSIFRVSRPYFYLNDVHVYCGGEWHDIEEPLSQGDRWNSFPSSHALRIFTVLGVFWTYKTFRIPFLAFALFAFFLIVYVYMCICGLSFVSDIIMGGATVLLLGYAAHKYIGRSVQL